MVTTKVHVGAEIPTVVKQITQEKINMFSSGERGGTAGSFHTDPEAAKRNLGIDTPIASGRMQLSFAAEALRRFFGPQVFNHSGTLDIRYTKPVVHGDTVTVHGKVTETKAEGKGTRAILEVWCENQKAERTSVGTGSALLPR